MLGDSSPVRLPGLSCHSCALGPSDPHTSTQEAPPPNLTGWRMEAQGGKGLSGDHAVAVWFWLFPPLRSQPKLVPSSPLCYFPLTHFLKTPTPVAGFRVTEPCRYCGSWGASGQALGLSGLPELRLADKIPHGVQSDFEHNENPPKLLEHFLQTVVCCPVNF